MEITSLPFTSPLLPCAAALCPERHSCLQVRLQVKDGGLRTEEKKEEKEKKERKRKRWGGDKLKPDWATLPDLLLIKIFKYLSIEVRKSKGM